MTRCSRKAKSMLTGGALVLTALISLCSAPVRAQVPEEIIEQVKKIAQGEDSKPDEKAKPDASKDAKKDKEGAPDESGSASEEKGIEKYGKVEKKPLPEGPVEVLQGPVAIVSFEGMVNPGMGEYTIESIERAQREGAQAVLIELNTPGGLVSTTEKIVQAELASKIPVIVHVTPRGAHAASAGTFITLAAHIAAMAPATRIGAAHPVTSGGKDPEAEGGKHMAKKVENDLIALVEGIAKERERNADWAKDAVLESVSATADDALEIGVIDLVANDRQDLLEKLDGRQLMVHDQKIQLSTKNARIVEYEPSIRNRLLNLLASPGIAMLLFTLGVIGIMVEVKAPGTWIPGIMGMLCILCALIAMEQLPIDVGAAILVLVGIGLLIAEVFTPTYGALGVLGGIGLTIGLLLLIDTGDPDYKIDPSFRLDFIDVLPIVVLLAAFVGYLSFFVVRSKRGRPVTGREGLIGTRGRVLKAVGPSGGQVFVEGEYWQAVSPETIDEAEEIEVVRVDGLTLEVRRRKGGA